MALGGASGRVLDLADPAARARLGTIIDLGIDSGIDLGIDSGSADGRVDVVLSFAELVRFPDLGAALMAIDAILAPTGRLELFEPVGRPGTVAMVADAPFGVLPATTGFQLGRDALAALRTTSLVAVDVGRTTLATPILPLRHFLSVTARRVIVPAEPSTSEVRS